MIKISKDKWASIHPDYKDIWEDYYNEHPEWTGKRCIMSTCILNNPNEKCYLMIEGIDFEIEE